MSSARVETSVAVIRRACPEQCSTCTPHPVPTSSSVSTGRRTVARASDSDAAPVPSTCSRSAVRPRGVDLEVREHPPRRRVRDGRRRRAGAGPARRTPARPGRRAARRTPPRRRPRGPAPPPPRPGGTASPSRNSRISVPASPGVPDRPAGRRGLAAVERGAGPRTEERGHPVDREPPFAPVAMRKPRHIRASGTTTPSVTAMSGSGRSGRGTHVIVTLQPQSIIATLTATSPIAPLPRAGMCVTRTHTARGTGVDGARRCP